MEKFSHPSSKSGKLARAFSERPSLSKCAQRHTDYLDTPAKTVEAKRSFSCMRRVKTWLRSHMTSDRLSDLCVLHCHHERVDEEKINRILATMAGEKQ